ncbi:ring-cleaving dioxygenase [Jiella sonneratiae]|uniref:Ring-cleaving dioxygenase n=1 Tax=Jiella sonneratiae TaxID=2816856 RepID=A0ABS3J976_9HYPH|nr:ring-cleaving dioxygenase [Jiella sonneratiae]MBO0906228.1 ring-cleaving dioxygenase [Jiella sonneratiae]
MKSAGIHHVTAIAGPAARCLDFYVRVLGLRLVKKTVNFDDPTAYHLYFGDDAGRPGTIVTFFPLEHAARGRVGVGEVEEIMLEVPAGSLGFWSHRLIEKGVEHSGIEKRFGESVLPFKDPDGLRLSFVGVADPAPVANEPSVVGTVPAEHAIRGIHGVSLLVEEAGPTEAILADVFGFERGTEEGSRRRFSSGAAIGGIVDVHAVGGFLKPRPGRGSVHHLAFRAEDDAAQAAMVERLASAHGSDVTEQKDRKYFRSVYFREPGHVLFEIATDAPGFAVDEAPEALGSGLMLPDRYESLRQRIEATLPEL